MKQTNLECKILIVIVTYNGVNHIYHCLSDIISLENSKIIIIDNQSKDTTLKIVTENFPNIETIKNDQNIGFGLANNIGLKYAIDNDFNYVLLLNQDTYIDKSTVSSLVKMMNKNQEYGILSPLHFYSENKLQKSFSNHIKANDDLIQDKINGVFSKEIYDLPFVNAAIWLMSLECITRVGGFCPAFFHYGEDDNYCHRVLYHGLKIGIVPSLSAFHYSDEKHSKYFSKMQAELMIVQEKINILNPLINYDYTKRLLYYFLRILKNLLLFRNQSFVLIKFFSHFKKIKINRLKELRDQSKIAQPLYLKIN